MELGIFAKTFPRPTVDGVLDAVVNCGLRCNQFNLSCAGLPTLPDAVELSVVAGISRAFKERGMQMAAISGTFNMIDPDVRRREVDLRRLTHLIEMARPLGTRVVTLCTGTRDPNDMWRAHPENGTPSAWRDLLAALATVVPVAEAAGVVLAVEPEHANVIDSAAKAERLLAELATPALGIIVDAANLLAPDSFGRQQDVLSDAMERLGAHVVLAHAKDIDRQSAVRTVGEGAVDWNLYLSLLRKAGFEGSLIIHGVEETQAAKSVKFLREQLAAADLVQGPSKGN